MIRKLIRVIAVLVVVVIVLLVVIALNVDRLLKAGVEKGGTAVLGVLTDVERASVSIPKGTVQLDQLVLGSPEGFDAPEMFRLGHMDVTLDLLSLRRDEIVVKEVLIDGPEVTLEFAGGRTNWGVLLERLRDEPSEEEEEMKNIGIDRVVVRNGKIKLKGVPIAETHGIPLPNIELTDLRSPEGDGLKARDALARVVVSLREKMAGALEDRIPEEQMASLKRHVASGVEAAEGLVEEVVKPKELLKDIMGDEGTEDELVPDEE
jgi:hypothetical protein